MKSGVWVLDHDTGYRNIKKDLIKRYGKETVQRIWEKAGANWEELCARYTHLPGKIKQHTDGQMFRMASVYMALKEAYPEAANQTHYEVGKKVRQTIKELGGTMPEDLPTPTKSIKQIESEQRQKLD